MEINKIPTVWLPLTYRCNNKCSWCYAQNETSKNSDLSSESESLFLNFLSDLNVKKIVLIGGEPTLYQNLPRLISEANKKNIRVGMVSNGRKLADYDFCNELKDCGLYSATVSLEGSNEKLHDQTTGVKGSFRQSLKGLENVIKVGIQPSTETVMSRENDYDLENIVSLVEQYDLKQSAFSICGPCLSDIENSDFSLTLNQGAKMFEKVYNKAKYKDRMKLITSTTICSFDKNIYSKMEKNKTVSKGCHILAGFRFVLEPNGNVLPCVHFAGLSIFNVFKEKRIMSAQEFLEEYNSSEGTNQKFRKLLRRYPSTKCRDDGCWGNKCAGGCPIFWFKYNPEKEIKGLNTKRLKCQK